jgi:hypothetical protein
MAVPMNRIKLKQQLDGELEKVLAAGNGGLTAGPCAQEGWLGEGWYRGTDIFLRSAAAWDEAVHGTNPRLASLRIQYYNVGVTLGLSGYYQGNTKVL